VPGLILSGPHRLLHASKSQLAAPNRPSSARYTRFEHNRPSLFYAGDIARSGRDGVVVVMGTRRSLADVTRGRGTADVT
jgi:hypothetical protein